jgi:hypothetical protein
MRPKAKALGYLEAKAKAKYGGLSTAAAKCAAFGRDDVVLGWVGGEQATAKATAKYGGLSTAAAKCAAFGRDDGVLGLDSQA